MGTNMFNDCSTTYLNKQGVFQPSLATHYSQGTDPVLRVSHIMLRPKVQALRLTEAKLVYILDQVIFWRGINHAYIAKYNILVVKLRS